MLRKRTGQSVAAKASGPVRSSVCSRGRAVAGFAVIAWFNWTSTPLWKTVTRAGWTSLPPSKRGRGEDDIEGLPFAGLAADVDQGRRLPVDRRGLAVR